MPVHLEKGSGTHLILVSSGSISNYLRPRLRQHLEFMHLVFFPLSSRGEERNAADFRQVMLHRLRPPQQTFIVSIASAKRPSQQTLVRRIGKQLNLFHLGRAAQSAELKQSRHHPIDQRRTDWTLAHRKEFAR